MGADDPFADVAEAFAVDHYADLRGRVRTEVLDGHLVEHLAGGERIVDVGGGSAEQDVPLARRGHEVVVLDPSEAMLARARRRLDREPAEVRTRISLVLGDGERGDRTLGAGRFDLVCCHGVLMYLEDPVPLLRSLVGLVRPGGLLSIVATNRHALALRPGLRGDVGQALALLEGDRYRNGLGRSTRADDPVALGEQLRGLVAEPRCWYGVRTFTDAWEPHHDADDPDAVIALEAAASRLDPYRQVSRLFHLVARRTG